MKRKSLLILTLAGLLVCNTNAQNSTFEWAKSMGGTNHDLSYFITTDALGNVYTTGYFRNTVDFDPGSGIVSLNSNNGSYDIFVQKLDPSGNLVWAKSMGGYYSDFGWSISTDVSGNVFITGIFQHTVDFDPGSGVFNLSCNGTSDIFILKLDASGNFQWVKSIGGTGSDKSYSITTDALKNIYLTGYFSNIVDFDPGNGVANLTSNGYEDIFIQKMDSLGNFIWAKSIGGTGDDRSRSIAVDTVGNIYITGEFAGLVDFNPDTSTTLLNSHGDTDIFIQKFDAAGNFIWVKSFGGYSFDAGRCLTLDSMGNVYITGFFKNAAYIITSKGLVQISSNGEEDIFVEKLDANGNFLWIKTMGGIWKDYGYSITTDPIGKVYITGSFQNTVDFDPDSGVTNLSSIGSSLDIFIQKLDSSGNFLWVESMGGASFDESFSISVDGMYNICISGYFYTTADFDPGIGITNLTSNGIEDIFVAKLSQCIPTTSSLTMSECNSYTWPINNNTYTYSGIYTATLTNAAGCDSVITLNLTINTIDNSVSKNGITLTANENGASYQWLDCNSSYSIISSATNQSYTATANGDYAVEITKYTCVDTSICNGITTIGLIENSFGEEFYFYPNPTTSTLNLELGEKFTNIQIFIRNSKGKLIKQENILNSQNIILEIEGSMGIYFVEIISGNKRAIIKVIKQ